MKSFDIDVERAVLGDLMVFDSLKDEVVTFTDDDFDYDEHKSLFSVMKTLYGEYGKYDHLSVSAQSKGNVKQVIADCISAAVSVTTYTEHKRLLKEMASVRRLKNGIDALILNGEMSAAALDNLLQKERFNKLHNDLKKQNCENATRFIANVLSKENLLKTGFPLLDCTLGGLRKGTLFTVGARPSTGKTAFAVNVAKNIYEMGKKVMFFSLEMSVDMIYERYFSNSLNIDYRSFISKTVPLDAVKKIGDALNKTRESLFVLDDVYSVEQICNIIMEQKPDFAVIDFMQIISTVSKFKDIRLQIDYISALLKRTAKTTGTVIMVLSQLSRAGKDSPTMSDLKESGGLEQDGDYIALLHRPYVLKKDVEISPGETELLIDKNKFGATGKINMFFDLRHQRFNEVDL